MPHVFCCCMAQLSCLAKYKQQVVPPFRSRAFLWTPSPSIWTAFMVCGITRAMTNQCTGAFRDHVRWSVQDLGVGASRNMMATSTPCTCTKSTGTGIVARLLARKITIMAYPTRQHILTSKVNKSLEDWAWKRAHVCVCVCIRAGEESSKTLKQVLFDKYGHHHHFCMCVDFHLFCFRCIGYGLCILLLPVIHCSDVGRWDVINSFGISHQADLTAVTTCITPFTPRKCTNIETCVYDNTLLNRINIHIHACIYIYISGICIVMRSIARLFIFVCFPVIIDLISEWLVTKY